MPGPVASEPDTRESDPPNQEEQHVSAPTVDDAPPDETTETEAQQPDETTETEAGETAEAPPGEAGPDDGAPDPEDLTAEHDAPTGAVALAGNLAIHPTQTRLTAEQRASLVAIGIGPDVPLAQVRVFIHVCQARGLDPWAREAYLIGRGLPGKRKYTIQTGIDGFRKLGEDTGQYRGQIGPQWCGTDGVWREWWRPSDGTPVAARVGILREGFDVPVYGVATYDEFVAMQDEYAGSGNARSRTGRKVPTEMWAKMPANQLAKCAEAQAWRKTFPRQTAGLYVAEELSRADAEERDRSKHDAAARRREAYQAAQAQAQPYTEGQPVEGEVVGADQGPQPAVEAAGETPPETPSAPPAKRSRKAKPTAASEPVSEPETVEATAEPAPEAEAPSEPEEPAPAPLGEAAERAALLVEIAAQAQVMDTTVARMARRWISAHRCNVEDASHEQLLGLVGGFRAVVIERLRQQGRGEAADRYAALAAEPVIAAIAEVLGDSPAGGAESDAEPAPEPGEPHAFAEPADGGDRCAVPGCGRYVDDEIHPGWDGA